MDQQTRNNMIEQQIRPWGVLDESVLSLYRQVRREDFVADANCRDLACTDVMLPIGHGQVMLEPKLEARMLQALAVQPHEHVLHIGCGSGFFAALLGNMAAQVVSVEIIPELATAAAARLADSKNVRVITGDGAAGAPPEAAGPYDAIVLTGSTPLIPTAFYDALKDGGRLLAVEGNLPIMALVCITRQNADVLLRHHILETCIPPLHNAPAPSAFQF